MTNKNDLPLEALCDLLETMHEKLIYLPSLKLAERTPGMIATDPWPKDMIMAHLVDHMQEHNLQMSALVKDATLVINSLKETLIQYVMTADGRRKAIPHHKNIISYQRFCGYKVNLIKNQQFFKTAEITHKRN